MINAGVEDWSEDTNGAHHRRIHLVLGKSAGRKSSIVQDEAEDSDPHGGGVEKITDEVEVRLADLRISKVDAAQDIFLLFEIWYHAIRIYPRRKMSFPEDKLSAIAGLAAEYSSLSGDKYFAGLWRGKLLRDLMWSTWPDLHLMKPENWRAPTWSWASIDNNITFDRPPGIDATPLAEISKVECTLRHETFQFGEVKDGLLEINGPVIPMDSEIVSKYMRQEYAVPAPEGNGLHWIKKWSNLLPQDGGSRRSGESWEAPEGVCLLGLWADFVDAGEEAQRRWNADGEKAAKEKGEVWDENHFEEQNKVYVAHMQGLVLEKRKDGKYERVSSYTELQLACTKQWLREGWETCSDCIESAIAHSTHKPTRATIRATGLPLLL
jgi:hypothetical protein